MSEKKLVPKRRFEGFDEKWKLVLVKDLGSSYYGGGTPNTSIAKYWDGNIPWLQSSNLKENLIKINEYRSKITKVGLQNSSAKLIPENSIAIVTRVGVGKLALIPYEYATSQDFLSIANLNVKPYFGTYTLYNLLQKEKQSVQGTSIKGMTKYELLTMELLIATNPKEQQKIGEFFKLIDKRIANQEQKIAKTKALKSAYLTEMFPQEGETVPKRRFAGFTKPWKQYKMMDLTEISTGYPFSSTDFSEKGKYLVVTNKNIMDQTKGHNSTGDRIDVTDKEIIANYNLSKSNVLISMDGDVGNSGMFTNEYALLAQRVGRLNSDKINFIYQVTKERKFKQWMEKIAVGNIIQHISLKQIADYTFYAPESKQEQQKIGEFFKNIDDQIELEETKLAKLKQTKKAYLEEMFV